MATTPRSLTDEWVGWGSAITCARIDRIEKAVFPRIGLDDQPPADQPAIHRCRHGTAFANSFGSRTRLQAAAANVNIQPS